MRDNRQTVTLEAGKIAFRTQLTEFETDATQSPFVDHYDYIKEQNKINEILANGGKPDEAEEIRIAEFESRMNVLKLVVHQTLKSERKISNRMGIRSINLDDYIIKVSKSSKDNQSSKAGRLVQRGSKGIYLHTADAAALFKGMYISDGETRGTAGCIQAATQVSAIYFDNVQGNPYVDQTLIYLEARYNEVFGMLSKRIGEFKTKIEIAKQEGFLYPEVTSVEPKLYHHNFNCQYAIRLIRLVLLFDEYNRYLILMFYQGDLSHDQAQRKRNEVLSTIRRLFNEYVVQARALLKDGFNKQVTYANWLKANDQVIEKLAAFAAEGYGVVEDDILTRKVRPSFAVNAGISLTENDVSTLLEVNSKIRTIVEQIEAENATDS